jgi:hypothetical protein
MAGAPSTEAGPALPEVQVQQQQPAEQPAQQALQPISRVYQLPTLSSGPLRQKLQHAGGLAGAQPQVDPTSPTLFSGPLHQKLHHTGGRAGSQTQVVPTFAEVVPTTTQVEQPSGVLPSLHLIQVPESLRLPDRW